MARHDRFTYDLRADCHVLYGIVVAYRAPADGAVMTDLSQAVAAALTHDGVLHVWRDQDRHITYFASCRILTDLEQAFRFARAEGQTWVHNLNRELLIEVPPAHIRSRRSPHDLSLPHRRALGAR